MFKVAVATRKLKILYFCQTLKSTWSTITSFWSIFLQSVRNFSIVFNCRQWVWPSGMAGFSPSRQQWELSLRPPASSTSWTWMTCCYQQLYAFDRDMNRTEDKYGWLAAPPVREKYLVFLPGSSKYYVLFSFISPSLCVSPEFGLLFIIFHVLNPPSLSHCI